MGELGYLRPATALAVMAVLGGAIIACGGGSKTAPFPTGTVAQSTSTVAPTTAALPSPTASPTATPIPQPKPTAEVVWTFFSPSDRFFRGLVILKNPSDRAITGVELRWDAADKDGVLVGSFPSKQPDIPAGGIIYYSLGAAATLSGQPASVKVNVTAGGSFTNSPVNPLAVDAVSFSKESSSLFGAPYSYSVGGNVTIAGSPVTVAKLTVVAVLKDADGKIVGAAFVSPPTLPDPIPPGTKVRYEDRFLNATGVATTAEMYAYIRP
jgi:hypothetical protein